MDQDSVLVENVAIKPTNGNHEQQAELLTKVDQRGILTPEVSNLITSVNELAMNMAIKNFEMFKMARVSDGDLGLYQMWRRSDNTSFKSLLAWSYAEYRIHPITIFDPI